MTMADYLAEIRYAVEEVLKVTWFEHAEAHKLFDQVQKLKMAAGAGYGRAEAIALNAEDPDDVAMATGAYFETYFGADKDRHEAQQELDPLLQRLEARKFSVDAAAGAVLQFAKQGISVVHGGPAGCPDGRLVTTDQSLKNLIWQGRNQAMHWDEGRLNQQVVDCFTALAAEKGGAFGDYLSRSLAFGVLGLLGWRTWEDFERDLLSIG